MTDEGGRRQVTEWWDSGAPPPAPPTTHLPTARAAPPPPGTNAPSSPVAPRSTTRAPTAQLPTVPTSGPLTGGPNPTPGSTDVGARTPTYVPGHGPRPPEPPSRSVRRPTAPPPPRPAKRASAPTLDLPRGLVSRGLAGTLQAFLWMLALGIGAVGGIALVARANFEEYWDAPSGSLEEVEAFDLWQDYETAMVVVFLLAMVAWLVAFILLVVWMHQAHHASQRISPAPRTWSQGWTIGGWFIPVASLLIPRLVLGEIETIANGRPTSSSGSTRWVRGSQSGAGWVWWVLMVGGVTVTFIGFSVLPADLWFVVSDPGAYKSGYATIAVGCFVAACGIACGAVHVSQLTRALNDPS